MPNGKRWVGLDVHAHASAVAVFDDVGGEVITRRVVGRPMGVLDVVRELGRPLRAVYEAAPTGYGLVRRARAEGIEMAVCSPGNLERRPGDRIKTGATRSAWRGCSPPAICGWCGCPASTRAAA
jgi:transposase